MRASSCVLLSAAMLLVRCCQASEICGPGLNTPGVTIPKGDITLEHGNPLEIFCVLNLDHHLAQGANSSQLLFYHNEKLMLPEFVSVVNSTTIRLYVEKPPPSRSMYYCKLRTHNSAEEAAVCLNAVAIAYKPQEVVNFTCVSHNWENLACSWTKPVNYIKTEYSLVYRLPGRAGGRLLYGCPNRTDLTENRCFWDVSTDPHYRQPYEYYYFTMSGDNLLGNVTFPLIKFHHYSHVIPKAPEKLSLINRTSESVCLEWSVPFPMQVFPPGLIHRVRYQSEWDTRDHWDELTTSPTTVKLPQHVLDMSNLTHANTLYDVKVTSKSAAATAIGNEMVWSPPASITVKTKPAVPGAAPKTDVGSFEVSGGLPNRFVYLYWQHIPENLKNGEQFEYKVYRVDEQGKKKPMVPSEHSKSYAKFKDVDFNSHKFVVVSSNREGHSVDQSTIYVPSRLDSPPEPLAFTKIAFGKGIYELSWRPPPERTLSIVNYTIFWCDNERDRPYQCTGFLDWVHVPSGVHIKKVKVPEDKIYQFAISANSKKGSSGMVWASCTVIHDKVIGKMKNVWINRIGPRFIEVGWKLDCSDRVGIVTGFRISYCPIVGPQHIECKEPEQNTTVEGDPSTIHGMIKGLKPYTTYMVAVAVVTKNGDGLVSDPLLNTTLEAAPETPPRDITVVAVTNSSIELSWNPPLQTNGLLRYYKVQYNDQMVQVEIGRTSVLLSNLSSYTNVSVGVKACTVECSAAAAPATGVVTTLVGYPSMMDRPVVQFINTTQVLVSWHPPLHTAGPNQFYELLVQQRSNEDNTSTLLVNCTRHETQIQIPDCKDNGSILTYRFMVRAVNIGLDNRLYPGDWSLPGEGNCYNAAPARNMLVIIWVFSILAITVVCLVGAYAAKRLWHRCRVMQVVEVKLPPGLAPMSEKETHIQVHTWPVNDGHDAHKTRPSAADEELLLDKVSGRNPSGDSSGCSSGHESVSSSVATHSSCDSGTEVDQRPPSPDGVFAESASWECPSLEDGEAYVRMGKMVSAHSTPNLTDLEKAGEGVPDGECMGTWSSTGYISMPSSEEMAEPGGGYCRVGLDPAVPCRPTAKGYVTIASMSSSPVPSPPGGSGGYVAHGPAKIPTVIAAKAYVTLPALYQNETGLPPESYCRMGLHPGGGGTSNGYIPLSEGVGAGGEPAPGYMPHTRLNNVFAAGTKNNSGLCHVNSPTTSV